MEEPIKCIQTHDENGRYFKNTNREIDFFGDNICPKESIIQKLLKNCCEKM